MLLDVFYSRCKDYLDKFDFVTAYHDVEYKMVFNPMELFDVCLCILYLTVKEDNNSNRIAVLQIFLNTLGSEEELQSISKTRLLYIISMMEFYHRMPLSYDASRFYS